MTDQSTEIIIALRQPWLELILRRTKTAELRRTAPRIMPPRLHLYHRGCLHGTATVEDWETILQSPRKIASQWADRLCMSHPRILEYLDSAANPTVYALGTVTRYKHPIPIQRRPQSWIYLDPETAALLPTPPQS